MAHLYIKSGAFIKMLFFDRFRDVESEYYLFFSFFFVGQVYEKKTKNTTKNDKNLRLDQR